MHTCHAHPSEDSVLTRSSRIASIGRLEQLYAFCDTDCDGSISEGEFVKGYDKMVQVFVEKSAAQAGVSRVQILIFVALLLLMLSLFIVFILLTLSMWNAESSFTAVVQAGLVSGCGKAATFLRAKSKAEEGNVDSLVHGAVGSHQEATDEAGTLGGEADDALDEADALRRHNSRPLARMKTG